MADEALIRRWLIWLGKVCSAKASEEHAEDFLDAFTPLLAMRFGNEAFTPVSLEHVAAQCRYLPTYGELVPLLSAWVRERRTAGEYAALPPPKPESREPYELPPPPEWAFEREPRHLGRRDRDEIRELIQKPIRTPAEQYAELTGCPIEEALAKFGEAPVDA